MESFGDSLKTSFATTVSNWIWNANWETPLQTCDRWDKIENLF